MKTLTKYENLKEMEVELYESIFRDEYDNVEMPTYGIKINDVIFDDISVEKDVVSSLVNIINKMMSGDEKARHLIHCMLVESVSEYNNDIVNF
jgi:hypothetical protein